MVSLTCHPMSVILYHVTTPPRFLQLIGSRDAHSPLEAANHQTAQRPEPIMLLSLEGARER